MLKDLILKNRSYRRFHHDEPVELETLHELVDLARLSPSARNAQPLKYFLSNSPELNDKIFPHLSWAGYLKDWPGPEKGEQPSAYIVMLNDTEISANYFCDDGIASQSILLGAVEKGLGGCIIGSLNRLQLQRELRLSDNLKIVHVIALGKPKEEVKLEEMKEESIKYWRDVQQVHHVPKRDLKDIIV
ncbi:nitroreductase family protein [Carboxylicivirga sp. A043]|uniref:nitroreductase family protein n=1 Tax=Carboxylicivirga litoralis TaxID=2816963 RepID=UPI0021CB3348|nr:nitroreductase family protein [Carboxylicivirga sp. A043]MCU4157180.1 nitroreductase family protein [Carboxylicivirga sp. A043]